MSYWHLGPMKGTGGRMSPINGQRKWVFQGPQGQMTLQEAQRAGYEVRHHSFFGMVAPVPPGMKSRNQTEREMNERAAREHFERRMGMQNSPALRYAATQEVGNLQAGEAKHMGVPCMMPRPGWRERLRAWRRR